MTSMYRRTLIFAGGLSCLAYTQPTLAECSPFRPFDCINANIGSTVASPAAIPSGMSAASSVFHMLVPVRMFLRAKDIPPKGVGAYGIVALRGLPTSSSQNRLMMLCNSFVRYLPRSEDVPASVALNDRMITAWPLKYPTAPEALRDDCHFLTQNYDLYGGISAISDATQQGGDLSGQGPFLIGWSPSSNRGRKDQVVLIYNMSNLNSQDSFDQAFIWWQKKIVSDPALWRNGWSIETLRLSIRDFFDKNAESALAAIKLFGGGK